MATSKGTSRSAEPVTNYYEFPYVRFHGRHYPLIPLTLSRGPYKVKTFALLDSGASISVFRPEISKALHLPTKPREQARLGTAQGGMNIGITKINVKIERTTFKANIGFSNDSTLSFNIIGREHFFNRFSVCFNEMMRMVILVPLRGNSR